MRRYWLLPLAAFLAVLPFYLSGYSCGLDFAFHLQSWLGAADQLRHGVLYPRWNFFAAWNAGEPRFIFYPPLSWELGALLTLLLPFSIVPAVLTWIVLTIAGFSMYRLARPYAREPIALLISCLFLANPFMLWTITGRDAFAELLCAAFCPLLIAAMLEQRPNPWRIGLPLSLMWLSNVPGGVLATYLLVVLALIRLTQIAAHTRAPHRLHLLLRQSATYTAGLLYGLALAAFFLIPANVERKYIRMGNAFQPGYRPIDNLFFHRVLTHNLDWFFIRTEKIFITLTILAVITLAAAWLSSRRHPAAERTIWQQAGTPIAALTAILILGMTFLAKPIWATLPALWVVQFPWRSLFILAAALGLALALAFRRLPIRPTPAVILSLIFTAALSFSIVNVTHLVCVADQGPHEFLTRFQTHRTPEPTDEYVVASGSGDFLRPDNPPFWLATNPTAYASNTTPNPAAQDPHAEWPAIPDNKKLLPTSLSFQINSPHPQFLIVNIQDYPNWRITARDGQPLPHLPRPDGLLTVALPAGPSALSIAWHHSWDEYLGDLISIFAVIAFLFTRTRLVAPLVYHQRKQAITARAV